MWRLPSDDTEFPQKPNQFTVNDAVSAEVLASAGVTYKYIDPGNYTYPSREDPWEPNATNTDPALAAYREENRYTYADIITVPKLYDSFWEEHYHGNSTIRYILAGSGFFDLRDVDDTWVRMHAKAGDFMEWPAGI